MSELPIQKKILLGTFALAIVLVPIVFGAVSSSAAAQDDRGLIPLVRINPDYPREALVAKREGQVVLEFTVTATGTTRDIVVVESTWPGFEEPSIAALARWRYMPLRENNQAVERRGMRTVISYRLADYRPDAPEDDDER